MAVPEALAHPSCALSLLCLRHVRSFPFLFPSFQETPGNVLKAAPPPPLCATWDYQELWYPSLHRSRTPTCAAQCTMPPFELAPRLCKACRCCRSTLQAHAVRMLKLQAAALVKLRIISEASLVPAKNLV